MNQEELIQSPLIHETGKKILSLTEEIEDKANTKISRLTLLNQLAMNAYLILDVESSLSTKIEKIVEKTPHLREMRNQKSVLVPHLGKARHLTKPISPSETPDSRVQLMNNLLEIATRLKELENNFASEIEKVIENTPHLRALRNIRAKSVKEIIELTPFLKELENCKSTLTETVDVTSNDIHQVFAKKYTNISPQGKFDAFYIIYNQYAFLISKPTEQYHFCRIECYGKTACKRAIDYKLSESLCSPKLISCDSFEDAIATIEKFAQTGSLYNIIETDLETTEITSL